VDANRRNCVAKKNRVDFLRVLEFDHTRTSRNGVNSDVRQASLPRSLIHLAARNPHRLTGLVLGPPAPNSPARTAGVLNLPPAYRPCSAVEGAVPDWVVGQFEYRRVPGWKRPEPGTYFLHVDNCSMQLRRRVQTH
jgi:hypothetical protein